MGSLVATPSLLSRVIKSQGQDTEIVSIRDRVQSDTGDEGWTVHADGSLRYRGRVVVPQLIDLREEILREFTTLDFSCIQMEVLLERDEETRRGLCSTMSHVSTS